MSKAERDARLDKLAAATEEWADKRIAQLEQRVKINTALLQGRTGPERLGRANVQAGSGLVVDSIDAFLLT